MEKLVRSIRICTNLSLLIIAAVLGASLGGCSEGVGDPCLPEVEGVLFKRTEIYIEASSVQCETRVCGVFRLEGDPKKMITDPDPNVRNAVEDHVFCTCRCRAPSGGFATCSCPDGFECSDDILEAASAGLRGGYCVRKGLMTVNYEGQ